MRALLSAAILSAASAQTWYGLLPTATSAKAAGANSVTLVTLTDKAKIVNTIGSVQLAPLEKTWPDGFRCIKGFCLFATTAFLPTSPLPTNSWIYNVSAKDASIISRASCDGFCRDVHVDYRTGRVFITSVAEQSTTVVEVAGNTTTPVVDITAAVGEGALNVGQSTHCSEEGAGGHMFVGVDNLDVGGGPDFVLDLDLAAGKIANKVSLSVPLFTAMWAKCDGSGVIGGLNYAAGSGAGSNGTLTFGSVDANGAYTAGDKVGVPPGYVPNGMLTATEDAGHFLAALYPAGTPTNATTGVSGYLWDVQPYGGSDDYVTPLSYYLIGAAMDTPA